MLDTLDKEIIDNIRTDHAYDFIANNAHLMDRETLKRIAMECIYEIGHSEDKTAMLNNIADELTEQWDY